MTKHKKKTRKLFISIGELLHINEVMGFRRAYFSIFHEQIIIFLLETEQHNLQLHSVKEKPVLFFSCLCNTHTVSSTIFFLVNLSFSFFYFFCVAFYPVEICMFILSGFILYVVIYYVFFFCFKTKKVKKTVET